MDININNSKMNANISNSNKDVLLETNKIDMQLENPNLNISTKPKKLDINLGVPKIVTHEKNHANLENLDFENSGHTGFQKAGDYALKSEIPKVPTKTSQLENDSNFATETYVDNELATFDFIKVVDSLPTTGLPNKIYLVPKKDVQTQDLFDEYIWVNNDWEYQGTKTLEVDLTPYVKKEEISNFVEDKNYVHTDNNFTDEDKSKLDELENFSGNAVDISYEDNYDNGVADVQEAIDIAFAEIAGLRDRPSIEEYENATIDLATFPVGVYYLKGIYTKIKYDNNKTMENIIKSNDQKVVLVALGTDGTKGKGVLFTGANSPTQIFMYVFGNGTWTNYDFFNFITSSKDQKITGNWTFNTLPISNATPTSYNQMVNKQYVDNKFITDLGYIDLDDYDGDVYQFIGTLIDEGKYKFTDSYDDFVWLVEVETVGNRIGQRYWYQEEGFILQYYRDGWYNEAEDVYEWNDWTYYIDYNSADDMFARKEHVHYSSINTPNLRDFLNGNVIDYSVREYNIYQTSDKKLFYVRVFANNYYLNNAWRCMRYQEYYDTEEPSKIYKRTGTAKNTSSSATVTWDEWCVFDSNSVNSQYVDEAIASAITTTLGGSY